MCSLVRNQKVASATENRNLTFFPHFTLKTFLSSEFQSTFDSALADQFVFGETVKKNMNTITDFVDYTKISPEICKNRYVKVNKDFSIYNCDSRMVYSPAIYDELQDKKFEKDINKLTKTVQKYAPIYYYILNDSNNFNFSSNEQIYDFSKYLDGVPHTQLHFNTYNDYKKYFYKTDHHWNYYGSYEGYKAIINMLFDGKEEPLKPEKLVDFNVEFRGSMSRDTQIYNFKDDFKGYKFNFDDHNEYLDKKIDIYGGQENYFDGKIENDLLTGHYGKFYGDDRGEIIFDYYDNKDRENLLIMATSYSNPINNLIASHFHKTYVVDLRHYENANGEKFNYKEYIRENNIDKVLIIGNYTYFADEDLGI